MANLIRKKVLIVDDERDLVDPIARRLAAGGRYEVSTAFDGEDGLYKARVVQPDAALIDISMPAMDGWQLCRRLRADPRTRGVAIVMMTAWLSDDLERRARSEGVARLLLKPFEDADLLGALETLDTPRAAARGAGGERHEQAS